MSYQALYRKYRPTNFDYVVGQDYIVKTLKNQIVTERVSHAYLFCGTRGTGKTSTAKIFGKAINCQNLEDANPCDSCDSCENIKSNINVNVIEIDAASNNGVDDIRNIKDEVKYAPTEGKYKVYIIDEVHMLSISAFNALLKLLEEPPSYVIFILATTDPQKIPITILSRCQRFDFKPISSNDIFETLSKYLEFEKIDVEEDALRYISRLADGSMRDSLSLLDRCASFFYEETITLKSVQDIVGSVDDSIHFKVLDFLIKKDSNEIILLVDEIVNTGRDINQFINELLLHLRNLIVTYSMEKNSESLNISDEKFDLYKLQAAIFDINTLIYYAEYFSQMQSKFKNGFNKKIMLEIELIRLCSPVTATNIDELYEKINSLEIKIAIGNFSTNNVRDVKDIEAKKDVPATKEVVLKEPVPDDLKNVIDNWHNFRETFEVPLKTVLQQTEMDYENKSIVLICNISGNDGVLKNKVGIIKERLNSEYELDFNVIIKLKKDIHGLDVLDNSSSADEFNDKFEFLNN